jgi:hypothetical protein
VKGIVAVAGMVAGGACGQADSGEPSLSTRIDTINGTPHVVSEGAPVEWQLRRLFRIGSLDEQTTAFGQIRSVLLDDDGSILVADVMANQVTVFDSSGVFSHLLGRQGAGPGEFGIPYSLGWLGDSVAVMDWRNARIGLFAKAGAWLGSWRWQPMTGPQFQLLNGSPRDLYAPVYVTSSNGGQVEYLHLGYPPAHDTILVPGPPARPPTGPRCQYPNQGGIEFFGIPFGPQLMFSGGTGPSILVGWSGDYRIAEIGPLNDTLKVIDRVRAPIPISDEEWMDRTARYRRVKTEYPGTICDPDEQPRPASKPAFRWFGLDSRGRLWVEAYSAEGFVFDVFDEVGRLLASVAAPERHSAVHPVLRDSRLAVVSRDSMNVNYVDVYEVIRN